MMKRQFLLKKKMGGRGEEKVSRTYLCGWFVLLGWRAEVWGLRGSCLAPEPQEGRLLVSLCGLAAASPADR